jgi:hypothetical protein
MQTHLERESEHHLHPNHQELQDFQVLELHQSHLHLHQVK